MTSKSVATFQYLVYPPLLSMTTWISEIRSTSRWFQWSKLPWLLASGCLYAILSFIIVHRFSTVLRSGLFSGYSGVDVLFIFRNSVAIFDRWQGAPSWMETVQPWTCMCSFYLSNSTYLGHFKVVLGGINTDQQRHGTKWHLKSFGWAGISLWIQHISCQIAYPMAAWCAHGEVHLLHDAFVRKRHFLPLSKCLAKSNIFFFINDVSILQTNREIFWWHITVNIMCLVRR